MRKPVYTEKRIAKYMKNMELKNIELRPRIVDALRYANFETVSDVIYHNETELSKILNLSSKDIKELVKCIAQEIIKPCPLIYPLTNALKMLNSGEQFQLKKELGGLEGGAVYISTEGNIQMLIKRTRQMTHAMKQRYDDHLKDVDLLDNIKYITVPDLDTQYQVLHLQLPILLSRSKIRLVIIDSIAANFRVAYNSSNGSTLLQRSKELCRLGTKLKEISDHFQLPIVCVNQVSDLFSKNDIREYIGNKDDNFWEYDYYQKQFLAGKGSKIPALGLVWSNTINSRIMLSRADRTLVGNEDNNQRTITLMMAPYAPRRWD
ncbi:17865_t:CDS:2 [Rhizophagus irregularis]|nr:17865_t:CDS:2 [Rhizophagus irregularis]